MRQFIAIASNTFMEMARQPIFLLLTTASTFFCVFLACVPYFGFGDDPKLVKDSVLAVMLLSGLLGAVLSASNSLAREIRTGTVLAVLSKPVGRAQFFLAKYAGLIAVLTLMLYVNLAAALLASRMAFDAYGSADLLALGIFTACLVTGYLMGAFSNFFLRRPFVSDALLSSVGMVTLAFVIINFMTREGKLQPFGTGVDWRMIPASVLILFAVWVLAGLALVCSTRLELMSTLAICSALFLIGLMSDYLVGKPAQEGSWWAAAIYPVIPNWQLFWVTDVLGGKNPVNWSRYIGAAFGYTVCYVGATLALGLFLFEDRELS